MKMKNVLFILIGLIFLTSSCNTKRVESGVLHEKAVIITAIYSPSEHHTSLGTTMMKDYNNPIGGVDMNGNHGVVIGKMHGQTVQISESTIPEKYGIVFQCQHGTFTIEGSEQKHKILYDKLRGNINDTVDVLYKEIYQVTTKDDKEVERKLVDLDFIDAQKLIK